MFHPKTDGFIGVLFAIVFLAEQCHEIVLRYGNLLSFNGIVTGVVDILYNLVVADGTAFHNEKGVTETAVSAPIPNLIFQVGPIVAIETALLRTHVRHIEGLFVTFL